MKISILGGSGFLGSYIVDILSKKYKSINVLDLSKGKYSNKNINFIKCDITDNNSLIKSLKGTTHLFHLAGMANLEKAYYLPDQTFEQNIKGTINVLRACTELKIKKLLYSSTLYVAGDYGGFYGCSKRACEDYIVEFSKLNKFKYSILRYGSLYGPGSDSSNGLLRIITNAIKKKQVIYRGDPNTTREYINVSDAAKSTIEIMFNKKFDNTKINITGNNNVKILDLLNIIKDILKIKKKIIFTKDKFIGHYVRTPYTSSTIPTKFINNPHIDFNEGLFDLIEYLKNK